ncbi:glycosyltransferase [Synechococcus sp. UW140]|uniref:glycosyltransferase n=1 Tax=Synechococcus sp. UW140 TaxID=368503 RepID=UPI003137E406
MIRILGLALYGPLAASHRVRLSQFKAGLAAKGIELHIQSLLGDAYLQRSFSGRRPSIRQLHYDYCQRMHALRSAPNFDLVILSSELLPLLPAWLEHRLLRIPYIYDFDDAFFLKYKSGRLRVLRPLLARKFDRVIARAAAVTAGNQHLAAYAQLFNRHVSVLPSVVDTQHYRPLADSIERPFTVGWIGSPSSAVYLQALVDPLQQLACERTVRFLVVGGRAPSIPGVEVIEQAWTLEHELMLIQSFDVGVMPLPDSAWARGKCAYKLIQCLACAVPVVASPVGANLEAVPESCGFLPSSPSEWLSALRNLAADPALRYRMGQAGRTHVEKHYSLAVAIPQFTLVIKSVVQSDRRTN